MSLEAEKVDPRHSVIRDYIWKAYAEAFQVRPPWNGRDGSALKRLLKDNPSWTVDFVCGLVKNKFYSDEPVGPAWKWIPELFKYVEGPLDRYGKMRR